MFARRGHQTTAVAVLVLAAAELLAVGQWALACDMVCVADDHYESMLNRHKHVLVGRVLSRTETPAGPEFEVEAIRVWSGGRSKIILRNVSGMCGKYPAVGRVYLVFAVAHPQDIDMCSPVFAVWEERAKVAITRLDRARGLPPLWLPQEDLRP